MTLSDHTRAQLASLESTNVYNDTFRIWHDGPFGTINGFRLGRLPNLHVINLKFHTVLNFCYIQVEWSEINAAMGQSLLLLETLSNRLNFTFKTYKPYVFSIV